MFGKFGSLEAWRLGFPGSTRAMNVRGMTLVELLVVLVILAGLTAAVMTGAAATREKGRYEQTARDAEAMAEALARPDGLSLVSDLGFVPDDAKPRRVPHEHCRP